MPPEEFKEGKFAFINKNTGEKTELSSIGDLEINGTLNDSIHNDASFLTTPISGTIKFQKVETPGFEEARRLFNILNRARKTRTKKKLFNRIFGEPAGRLYLIGIGGTN